MKSKITIESVITVEFDENSKEFKLLFKNYNKFFQECDLEEFSEIIASRLLRDGMNSNIEGIGLIKINGKMQRESYFPPTEEIDHPINIVVEIDENREINCLKCGKHLEKTNHHLDLDDDIERNVPSLKCSNCETLYIYDSCEERFFPKLKSERKILIKH